ncbi:TRAF-type zinc finger domain-containing protein 1-like [Impatiens glandulifera]|uniref:TRAF-type zinc finger domain-containing protein 1-like n=1 Tax=Impatiens glandulifera TaxID=253017 RepID=UPI001FB1222F|nr:TRAF-type zinc finger domain-containing protein 1-like [Impatiens glandulifera]
MAISPDQASTNICTHCDRAIPSANIDLHQVHCSRNLERCKVCGDMVPRRHADEHFLNTHALVPCSLCSETMAREILDVHKVENCPQRIVTCEFCEFPLPSVDLNEHQEVCGNRTEYCNLCRRYVRLRERLNHESSCNGNPNTTATAAETSRTDTREAERRRNDAQRRQPPHLFPKRRLILTIAITGMAIFLGSFFFQRKPENISAHYRQA